MDTQGIVENGLPNTVFTLSTLLSSIQVYNVVETIHDETLANLSIFVEYGRAALDQANQFGAPLQVSTFQYLKNVNCLLLLASFFISFFLYHHRK